MRHFFRTNHVAQTMLLLLVLLMTSLVIGDGVLTPAQTGIMCPVLRRRSMRLLLHMPPGCFIACQLHVEAGSKAAWQTQD